MTKRTITTVLMTFILILILCTSCKKSEDSKIDEVQVRFILSELVPKAEEVVNLMFMADDRENDPEIISTSNGSYYPVKIAGYETTQDVKDVVIKVFTQERADIIINDIFEPFVDSKQRIFGARLVDINQRLYINIGFGAYEWSDVWVTSDFTILKQDENEILVEMPTYTVDYLGNPSGPVCLKQMELKKENGKWKINSALKGTIVPPQYQK